MAADGPITKRCVVYTRKSSEEGLEQEFNSLDAQREACLAYITSQRHEGWKGVKTRYDDGGFSGGNMERPALKRLLADIQDHKIDVVVVYKIDRLTRSLHDFAKIVDTFDRHQVSFVSITQPFNSTTPMGRLTLNVLLSFAQFEREITGERIRDKVAASKRKGMWMGGCVPLGYRCKDRKLIVVPKDAEKVKDLFDRYVRLGSVTLLKADLDKAGIHTPARLRVNGKSHGGKPYSRGSLYRLLKNPILAGHVRQGKELHPGEHQAIISENTWQAAQNLLAANRNEDRRPGHQPSSDLLTGRIFDHHGRRLTPTYTVKGKRRYRYYAAIRSQQPSGTSPDAVRAPAVRVSAQLLESVIVGRLQKFISSPQEVLRFGGVGLSADRSTRLLAAAKAITDEASVVKNVTALAKAALTKVTVSEAEIHLSLNPSTVLTHLVGNAPLPTQPLGRTLDLSVPFKFSRSQRGIRLVVPPSAVATRSPQLNIPLIKAASRAYAWKEDLLSGRAHSLRDLQRRHKISERYISKIFNLANLAPELVESILDGTKGETLTVKRALIKLPLAWTAQRRFVVQY